MKRLLLPLLFLPVLSWAGINVTQGSGKIVHTDTVGGDEYQGIKIIDGTTGGTSSMTVTSAGAALATVVQSTVSVVSVSTIPVSVGQWGGVAVTSATTTAPLGTESAQVTRPVFRKQGSILTTANLGNGGVFTGAWNDTNGEGTIFVQAAAFANQVSATNGMEIDETDDTTDSNFTRIVNNVSVSASVLTYVTAAIRGRYWRVKYTNGTVAQTSFKLTVTTSNNPPIQTSNQAVTISAPNSSTTNLTAGSTFTGLDDTTLGVGAIQVNVFADQNLTVNVDQSQDGTNWDVNDSWTYTANSKGTDASRTVQATASYVRVRVTNNGASTTTSFRLQTALAPQIEVVPRALTQSGNLKVSIQETATPEVVTGSTVGVVSASPLVVTGSTIGVVSASPLNVTGSTVGVVTPANTPLAVQITTAAVGGSSITIANWGIAPVLTGGQNGSVGVGGLASVGSGVGGRPVLMGVVVSSTGFQTTVGNQQVAWTAGDSVGRVLVTGMPYWNISSTASVNVSSQTTQEFIIISSATAPNYNYLCGCAFANTSATAVAMTIYNSSSTVVGTDFMTIQVPAGETRGIWPGCMNPFFRSAVGGQITLKASAVATSTAMRCQYTAAP